MDQIERTIQAFQPATPKDMRDIIQMIKKEKAPEKDGITNRMFTDISRRGIAAITSLDNAVIRLEHFPEAQ